jgi:hypothetical protein
LISGAVPLQLADCKENFVPSAARPDFNHPGRSSWRALYLAVQEGNLGYGDKRYVE